MIYNEQMQKHPSIRTELNVTVCVQQYVLANWKQT